MTNDEKIWSEVTEICAKHSKLSYAAGGCIWFCIVHTVISLSVKGVKKIRKLKR